METRPYQVATWLPEGQRGAYRVERFVVTGNEWQGFSPRTVTAGTYTRLMRGGTVVMSDTPAEWRDHSYFVDRAEGRVLVAGLGIGMVAAMPIRLPHQRGPGPRFPNQPVGPGHDVPGRSSSLDAD